MAYDTRDKLTTTLKRERTMKETENLTTKDAVDRLNDLVMTYDGAHPNATSWLIGAADIAALKVINRMLQRRREYQSRGGRALSPAKLAQLQEASKTAGRKPGSKDRTKRKVTRRKKASGDEV